MVRFAICDLRFAIAVDSASFAAALESKASPSKQAGQLPPGPSPESFAPHRGHVFTAGTSKSFNRLPPVTAQKLANGYSLSQVGQASRAGSRDGYPTEKDRAGSHRPQTPQTGKIQLRKTVSHEKAQKAQSKEGSALAETLTGPVTTASTTPFSLCAL